MHVNGTCFALRRSSNSGTAWNSLNQPYLFNECGDGKAYTLGAQGDPNLAMLADPTDSAIVYVAGTVAPCTGGKMNASRVTTTYTPAWDSSVATTTVGGGTTGYSSRIFRGNRQAKTWTTMGGAFGSLTGGSPHSDSRGFGWDNVTGDLLLTCDGTSGFYGFSSRHVCHNADSSPSNLSRRWCIQTNCAANHIG